MESIIEIKAREEYHQMLSVDENSLKEFLGSALDKDEDIPKRFMCNICLLLVFEPV